jgi:hypothetical protein
MPRRLAAATRPDCVAGVTPPAPQPPENASGAATSGADRRSAAPLSTLSTRSPPMPATQPAHSDPASRVAARVVTRPLGCRGQRPNTPVSLVAQAGSSHGTFSYSEADVRLGLLEVIFARDRPGIVTDFVTSTCPARVWEHTLSSVKTTQRRTTRRSLESHYCSSLGLTASALLPVGESR